MDESLTNVTYDARRCRSNCGWRRLSRKNRRHFTEKFGDEIPRSLLHLYVGWFDKEMTRLDRINWNLKRVRDFCLGEWFMKVIFNNVKKSFYVVQFIDTYIYDIFHVFIFVAILYL